MNESGIKAESVSKSLAVPVIGSGDCTPVDYLKKLYLSRLFAIAQFLAMTH